MSGARAGAVFRDIVLPLVRPAAFGAWIYIVLLCMRELTLAAFVSTPKNLTFRWSRGSYGVTGRSTAAPRSR